MKNLKECSFQLMDNSDSINQWVANTITLDSVPSIKSSSTIKHLLFPGKSILKLKRNSNNLLTTPQSKEIIVFKLIATLSIKVTHMSNPHKFMELVVTTI